MCFLKFLMASKYVNILPASGRKLLNGLVFPLLLPCLIFSQLGFTSMFDTLNLVKLSPLRKCLNGGLFGLCGFAKGYNFDLLYG
ncbi:hypothetical protein ACJW30_07G140900 [Castanea mollissima]